MMTEIQIPGIFAILQQYFIYQVLLLDQDFLFKMFFVERPCKPALEV